MDICPTNTRNGKLNESALARPRRRWPGANEIFFAAWTADVQLDFYDCLNMMKAKMHKAVEKKTEPVLAWYERVFESSDLNSTSAELKPILDADEYPEWVWNVIAELSRQGLHLSPAKEMVRMTPKRLGLLLGQKCANL